MKTTSEVREPYVLNQGSLTHSVSQKNATSTQTTESSGPEIQGKFFFLQQEKFFVRGVTYGAFEPNEEGEEYYDLEKITRDFELMARNGINTVRIPHTTPPRILLDIAHQKGLMVMTGLSAEQYVGYLIDKKKAPNLEQIIRSRVREVKGHPALFSISLGNEIPASIARWLGRKPIEKYLKQIYHWVKDEYPEALVTYVNYPTTEYLQLPFLDFLSFNVYLEAQEDFEAYLMRLHNIAGDRPLVMGEIGLDAIRNGEDKQSAFLRWQIESAFQQGCAGLFVFSWTDEWFRGGEEVYDWAFGLTDKSRKPKAALKSVADAFEKIPFRQEKGWPSISVVVCSYNGAATIRDTLEGLSSLTYPDYEVIVVNDGSTDDTPKIASEYDFRLINIENGGLSNARNLGMEAARGEIVAYIDDDAYPDPDWLWYLAYSFASTDFAAIGGPNIAPPKPGFIADCVDHTPGAPTHILISDQIAEHIPGCNMAFRKERLKQVGGFDTRFRVAGDDVDVCWKLQELGEKIGFSPAALVWHHRRNSIKGFWKQQSGYGKAEAMLEKKWPEKYNNFGHRSWEGRIYGNGSIDGLIFHNWRVYHGLWGSAPFQFLYTAPSNDLLAVTLMPEWFLITATLVAVSLFGVFWTPLLLVAPLALLAAFLPLVQIINKVRKLKPAGARYKGLTYPYSFKLVTVFLHIMQPLARLLGRLRFSLTPWRRFGPLRFSLPVTRVVSVWCENWISPELRLRHLTDQLKARNPFIWPGGDFDRWDLSVRGGAFGMVHLCMAAEDHEGGKQYLRFRIAPRFCFRSRFLLTVTLLLTAIAAYDQAWLALASFGSLGLLLLLRSIIDCSVAASLCKEITQDQQNMTS